MSAHDNQALLALLGEFSAKYNLGSVERLLAGIGFTVHGADFCFRHNEAWPDFLTVYCEFGQIPQDLREHGWRVLLEANLLLAHGSAMQQSFGLDPDTGAVIAATHQPLAELDLPRLSEWISDLAEQVALWQVDHFLVAELTDPLSATPSQWLARRHRH